MFRLDQVKRLLIYALTQWPFKQKYTHRYLHCIALPANRVTNVTFFLTEEAVKLFFLFTKKWSIVNYQSDKR